MDSNTVFRLAAAGLSGLVLLAAALALREPDVPEPVRVFPAVVPADPLAAELTRCRKLGLEAAGNQACEEAWAENRARFFSPPNAVQGALMMGGSGVIDQFLNVFTTYINSGFGLLGGDVRFLSQTLIALDITLAGLFWALAGQGTSSAAHQKTLYIGFFAFLISNFNKLAKIIFDSFSGLGLKAAGSGLSATDFLHPGRIAQVGLDAGTPILTAAGQLMGYVSFFENFIQITVLMIAWAIVVISFFILAVQLFITLIEFKLTTLAGFVLVPFGLFNKTSFLAEKVLGNVVASGIKILVLAVIIGIGTSFFSKFTQGFGGNQPTIQDALSLVLAALSLLGLGIFGPASRLGSSRERRSSVPVRRSVRSRRGWVPERQA